MNILFHHRSPMICVKSVDYLMYIFFFQGYTVSITQLGCRSQDSLDILEENYSIALDYDWQSQRISVQLKFLNEGCYHATIRYKGTELHNGDFDIIVLNSKLNFLKKM